MTTKKHCIVCKSIWGIGEDIETYGVCPECFSEWVNTKRKSLNQSECYGTYGIHADNGCENCFVSNLCEKDSYGIK